MSTDISATLITNACPKDDYKHSFIDSRDVRPTFNGILYALPHRHPDIHTVRIRSHHLSRHLATTSITLFLRQQGPQLEDFVLVDSNKDPHKRTIEYDAMMYQHARQVLSRQLQQRLIDHYGDESLIPTT